MNRALLQTYLPAPDNTDEQTFWSCLSCYEGLIDEVEESKPQNVCTRKFWELMIVQESAGQG